jgi:hypothetical protein
VFNSLAKRLLVKHEAGAAQQQGQQGGRGGALDFNHDGRNRDLVNELGGQKKPPSKCC